MVALSAEYRLTPEGVCVSDCVSDAKSAVRWIRRHAAEFGVDPNRIAAGGGSAGGFPFGAAASIRLRSNTCMVITRCRRPKP